MRNQKGYVAGYIGQAVVTADQVIVGAMLSQHPVDRTLLHPLLDTCRQQLAQAGLADSGVRQRGELRPRRPGQARLLAPLAKDPGRPGGRPPQRARHLDQYPATARAIRRLRHPRGREDYKLRARTAEPSVRAAQDLPETNRDVPARPNCVRKRMAAGLHRHNLRKLHRHRVEG